MNVAFERRKRLATLIIAECMSYQGKFIDEIANGIWCIRSSGHNVPQINGFEQSAGAEYCAKNVSFNETQTKTCLSMNLKDAYPAEAEIRSLHREFVLNHEIPASVEIKDSFEMTSGVPHITIPLFCKESVKIDKPGRLLIATNPKLLVLEYSSELLQAKISQIPIEDEHLNEVWGTTLHRIEFQYIGNKPADSYKLIFRALDA